MKKKLLKFHIVKNIINLYISYKQRERKISKGYENIDKTFYVIGHEDLNGGLWWLINKVIMHICYADSKQYIPIIDYKNFKTQYHGEGDIGKINVWELFFLQPCNFTLKDIEKSKNIILSKQTPYPSREYLMGNTDFYTDENRQDYFRRMFKKYIQFNEDTYKYLESKRIDIIGDSRVLGILCRGTDYTEKKPKGHPIQPKPETVISDAKKIMKEFHCDKIFLATEDRTILQMFVDEFGNKLCFIDQNRISKEQMKEVTFISEINKEIENKYQLGIDYLAATYVLSKCHCFIGGRTGGTKGVLLMSNNFAYKKVYDLGLY